MLSTRGVGSDFYTTTAGVGCILGDKWFTHCARADRRKIAEHQRRNASGKQIISPHKDISLILTTGQCKCGLGLYRTATARKSGCAHS